MCGCGDEDHRRGEVAAATRLGSAKGRRRGLGSARRSGVCGDSAQLGGVAAAATGLGEVRRRGIGSGRCGGGDYARGGAAATRIGDVAATRLGEVRRRLSSWRGGGD